MFNLIKNIPDGRVMNFHIIYSQTIDLADKVLTAIIRSWPSEIECLNNFPSYLEFKVDITFTEWDESKLLTLEQDVQILDWQYYNNEFVPPPPFDLVAAQNKKSDEIDSWRFVARYVNVFTTVSGVEYEWQADTNSQQLISNAVVMAINGIADAPPIWRTFDNIDVPVTLDDLKTIANTMVEQTRAAYYHSFELKAAVDSATTQEELDAITW